MRLSVGYVDFAFLCKQGLDYCLGLRESHFGDP